MHILINIRKYQTYKDKYYIVTMYSRPFGALLCQPAGWKQRSKAQFAGELRKVLEARLDHKNETIYGEESLVLRTSEQREANKSDLWLQNSLLIYY